MYEIIQMEKNGDAIIDSKDSKAEAEDYVSVLNGMHEQEHIRFYYRLNNQLTN